MNTVRQWFHTADGVVMPLLLTRSSISYKDIDRLTRWALESCSNNYSNFIRNLKKIRKLIRRSAMMGERKCVLPRNMGFMNPYVELYNSGIPADIGDSAMQYGLIWSQTRATGLADSAMAEQSVQKFKAVITAPYGYIPLDQSVLDRCTWRAKFITGKPARISSGPSSCLESTRQKGGLTGELSRICQNEQIDFHYHYVTMEKFSAPKHYVSSAEDILDYCIDQAIRFPDKTLEVRVHTVIEPSKARVITVGSFAYHAIMDVFSHIWHSVCASAPVKSGMTSTRHMWNFVSSNLDPSSPESSNLWIPRYQREDGLLWALSTDLETATDYANPTVGEQIWSNLIDASRGILGFPVGLAEFAKGLFFSPRRVTYKGKDLCVKHRGWFMGDPMTKILLTILQEYVYRSIPDPHIGSMVGDDLVVISPYRRVLRDYLKRLSAVDMKISDDDTVISCRYMFYCEECARVPQSDSETVRSSLKRGLSSIGYVDYPRIRLLLPVRAEINRSSYTDSGRFSLLGKETRWTCLNGRPNALSPAMLRAGLIQHVLLPEEPGTLAPYYPEELGGDGSYHIDENFVKRMWAARSSDLRETYYRAKQTLEGKLTFKFCRTDKPGHYGHQYRNWVTYAQMEDSIASLPPDAVVVPEGPAQRHLMECLVSKKILVTPDVAFLQLETARYYRCILSGFGIPEMDIFSRLPTCPSHVGRTTIVVEPDFVRTFLHTWQNPGFSYQNHPPYFVLQEELQVSRYLNLQWNWRWRTEKDPPYTLIERDLNKIVQFVTTGHGVLPPELMERLPLYLESDNVLSIMLANCQETNIRLVTADLKLAARLKAEYPTKDIKVVHPLLDLLGVDLPINQTTARVADPGALEFHTYAWFNDGLPTIPCNLRVVNDYIVRYRLWYYHYSWCEEPDEFLSMFTDKTVTWDECPDDFKLKQRSMKISIGGKKQPPLRELTRRVQH